MVFIFTENEVNNCWLFTWREEGSRTRKILEGETDFRSVYMQKFWWGCVVAGNQIILSVFSS